MIDSRSDYSRAETCRMLDEGGVIGSSSNPLLKDCPMCNKVIDINDQVAAFGHIVESHPGEVNNLLLQLAARQASTVILERVK